MNKCTDGQRGLKCTQVNKDFDIMKHVKPFNEKMNISNSQGTIKKDNSTVAQCLSSNMPNLWKEMCGMQNEKPLLEGL